MTYARGVNVNELRGVDGEDAVGVVRVADLDGFRDVGDRGALDHAAEDVLAQAVGDGVRGVRVHDLDVGLRVVEEAVREGVLRLGLELDQGDRGDVHLCTWGEGGVVAGVFGGDSGVALVG